MTYQLGTHSSGNLYWRLEKNDGGGFFSQEWIKDTDIQAALNEWPKEKLITSLALQGVFKGKSANNRSFLMAALVAEGLLVRKSDNQRHYQLGDWKAFLAKLNKQKDQA